MDTPLWLQAFVDDAAIFPPATHSPRPGGDRARRPPRPRSTPTWSADSWSATSRSPTSRTSGGRAASAASGRRALAVNLVVTGGAGAIEPAVTWVSRSEGLELRALEFALRDEEDLAHNARRLVQVVDSLGEALDDVTVFAEPPIPQGMPSHGWLAALDELAAREISLKFRTGGLSDDLFPTSSQLAACIEAALDRELPFKCTAGLHHAVRHRDDETGFEHQGFLNVLLATRTSLDGGGPDEVAQVLDETDGAALAERLAADPDVAARTRRWFTSFGSCSVLEAHEDLVELGLL